MSRELKSEQLVVQETASWRELITRTRDAYEYLEGTRPSEAEIVRRCMFRTLPDFLATNSAPLRVSRSEAKDQQLVVQVTPSFREVLRQAREACSEEFGKLMDEAEMVRRCIGVGLPAVALSANFVLTTPEESSPASGPGSA